MLQKSLFSQELHRNKDESVAWKNKFTESERRYTASNEQENKRRLSDEMAEVSLYN